MDRAKYDMSVIIASQFPSAKTVPLSEVVRRARAELVAEPRPGHTGKVTHQRQFREGPGGAPASCAFELRKPTQQHILCRLMVRHNLEERKPVTQVTLGYDYTKTACSWPLESRRAGPRHTAPRSPYLHWLCQQIRRPGANA